MFNLVLSSKEEKEPGDLIFISVEKKYLPQVIDVLSEFFNIEIR